MKKSKLTTFKPTIAATTWTLVGVIIVGLASAAWLMTTPSPRPSDAASQKFSAGRALTILERLLGDSSPHPIGTRANADLRGRIVTELESLGLAPEIQSRFVCGAYRHYCGTVHNALARIPGRRGSAVVLNAHYDSQPATPGAADALAGVASNLEIARILLEGDSLEHTVILLFNDGEEAGLLGATAFVDHHPWASDVVGFVNLEARGSGGPSTPAYTIGADHAVLGPYASGLRRRAPGSAIGAATALLPAANDIVVFDRLGIPGVTLGFASHVRHYHTPLDDLAHLDAGSVQQQGESALRITRALASRSEVARTGGRSSFVALGPFAPRWAEAWTPALAVGAASVLLFLVVILTRRDLATGRQLAWGLLAWPVTVIVAFFGSAGFNFVRRAFTESPSIWISRPEPTFFGFWAAAAFLVALTTWAFRRRATPWGLWLGGWLWWAASGAILASFVPGLGYLFLVPTLSAVCAAAALWALGRRGRDASEAGAGAGSATLQLVALGAPALIALLVWLPHAWFLKDFIGLGNMPPVATMVAIGLTGSLPLLAALPKPGRLVTGLAASAIVLLGIGTRVPVFSDLSPQWANIIYSHDADAGRAHWFYTGFPLPERVMEVGGFGDEFDRPLPWTPGDGGSVADVPFSLAQELPPPEVEVLESFLDGDRRRAVLRLRSPRGAPVLQLAVPAVQSLEEMRFDGVLVPEDLASFSLFDDDFTVYTIWTVPDSGVVAEFVSQGSEPVELYLADRSYGVLGAADRLVEARPADAVPISGGDATIVWRRVEIPLREPH